MGRTWCRNTHEWSGEAVSHGEAIRPLASVWEDDHEREVDRRVCAAPRSAVPKEGHGEPLERRPVPHEVNREACTQGNRKAVVPGAPEFPGDEHRQKAEEQGDVQPVVAQQPGDRDSAYMFQPLRKAERIRKAERTLPDLVVGRMSGS